MECCLMSINTINNDTVSNQINQPIKPLISPNTANAKPKHSSLTQPLDTDAYVPSSKLDNQFVTYSK